MTTPISHARSFPMIGDVIEVSGSSWTGWHAVIVDLNGIWMKIEASNGRRTWSGKVKRSSLKKIVSFAAGTEKVLETINSRNRITFMDKVENETEGEISLAEELEFNSAKIENREWKGIQSTRAADWTMQNGKAKFIGIVERESKPVEPEDDDECYDSKHWED